MSLSRRLAEDRGLYTKDEFLRFYGRIDEWHAAAPLNCQEVSSMLEVRATPEKQLDALQGLVTYLRDGDTRLVRPFPEKRSSHRQEEIFRGGLLPSIVQALEIENWEVRARAAEVVHLLCTSHPNNRDALGAAGVVALLLPLLKAGSSDQEAADEVIRAGEEAGEALWMLAYAGPGNSGKNHTSGTLHSHDVIEALADVATHGQSWKAKMWACSAIGNLTTSYDVVPSEISESARQQVLKRQGFVDELVKLARCGPVSKATPADRCPGSASCTQRHAAEIVAWGAMMALKSLALSETAHEQITKSGAVNVAQQHCRSPDWLEQMKGGLLLRNLGPRIA